MQTEERRTDRRIDIQTYIHIHRYTNTHTDRQIDIYVVIQKNIHAYIQIDRQTDRHVVVTRTGEIHAHIQTAL